MAYNVGQVTSIDEENSIFTEEEVDKYLGSLDRYPLPLDVALPIFSWGVRFHFDRFAAIVDNIRAEDLEERSEFKRVGENLWQARLNTTLRGEPVFEGDIIRVEQPAPEELLSIADDIAGQIDAPFMTLALYRYDSAFVSGDELDQLQQLYQVFQ